MPSDLSSIAISLSLQGVTNTQSKVEEIQTALYDLYNKIRSGEAAGVQLPEADTKNIVKTLQKEK